MNAGVPATGVWFFPDQPAQVLVEAIEYAERRGIDEVWLGDEGPAREPMAVLAAAAVRTSSIRLGVGITNPYVRHPAVAVAAAATIAELGPGRFMLGVGAGGAMSLGPFQLEALRPLAAVDRFISIARAASAGEGTEGYTPSDLAVAAAVPPVPLFVGARGPKLNALASRRADGAFVAGIPPFRYREVIGWARSANDIDIALYPSVAFDESARQRHRPEMIWSLLDAPADLMSRFDLDVGRIGAAADALRRGDPQPASDLIDDDLLDQLMIVGQPEVVGARLADLVVDHRPTSIGVAIVSDDLTTSIAQAAVAFDHMRALLVERGD